MNVGDILSPLDIVERRALNKLQLLEELFPRAVTNCQLGDL